MPFYANILCLTRLKVLTADARRTKRMRKRSLNSG